VFAIHPVTRTRDAALDRQRILRNVRCGFMARCSSRLLVVSALTHLLLSFTSPAQEPGARTRLPLWPEGSIAAGKESEGDPAVPTVDVHLPAPGKATGSAVVVLPGGGYGGISMDFEAVHAAQFLTGNGVAAFVMRRGSAIRCRWKTRAGRSAWSAPAPRSSRSTRTGSG
jgi:hypothetical protein